MSLIDDIRQQYPTPRVGLHCAQRGYCVGGALCLWSKGTALAFTRFPTRTILAIQLLKLNPELSERKALAYAGKIITANDQARFEEAWQEAGAALAWRRVHAKV